jgi:hypothetical protein
MRDLLSSAQRTPRPALGNCPSFTGISDSYEVPEDADVTIDTTQLTPEKAAQQIILHLESEGYIGADGSSAMRWPTSQAGTNWVRADGYEGPGVAVAGAVLGPAVLGLGPDQGPDLIYQDALAGSARPGVVSRLPPQEPLPGLSPRSPARRALPEAPGLSLQREAGASLPGEPA